MSRIVLCKRWPPRVGEVIRIVCTPCRTGHEHTEETPCVRMTITHVDSRLRVTARQEWGCAVCHPMLGETTPHHFDELTLRNLFWREVVLEDRTGG